MPKIRSSIFAYPLFHASVQQSWSSPHEISHNYVYTRPVCDGGMKRYSDPIQTMFWLDEAARRATGQHRIRRPSFDIFESQGRTIYSAHRKGQSSLPTHDCYLPDSQESISTHSAPHVKLYQKTAVLRRRHRSFGEPLRWEKNRRTHHPSHPLRKPEGVWAKNLCKTKEEDVSLILGQETPNSFEVDANTPKGWEKDDGWSRPSTPALTWSQSSNSPGSEPDTSLLLDYLFPEIISPDAEEEDLFAIQPCRSHFPREEDPVSLEESVARLFDLFINAEA